MKIDAFLFKDIVEFAVVMLYFEIFCVIFFVGVVYILKIYMHFQNKDTDQVYEQINQLLVDAMSKSRELTAKEIKFLLRNITETVRSYEYIKTSYYVEMYPFVDVEKQLIQEVFKKTIRSLATSWKTYNRYFAAKILNFYYTPENDALVEKLIKDKTSIVSVNAAQVGFKYLSDNLIYRAIDYFATYRRLRQTVLSGLLSPYLAQSEGVVVQKIQLDKKPYTKAFCYRLLLNTPATLDIADCVKKDLQSKVIELRVSALNYAGHNRYAQHLVLPYLEDEFWQVRAAAAKIMGVLQEKAALPGLTKLLGDPEWWVRVRSAEALNEIKPEGVAILKEQSPEKDKYAYEVATQVLIEDANAG